MKHSQLIGIIAAVLVITCCFFPWTYIVSRQLTISGMHAEDTNFGRPGLMNIILTSVSILLFAIPKIWAKRTNFFIAMLNLAWSIRNYILVASCLYGECPEKKPAVYLLILFSAIMLVMTLLPKITIKPKE